MGIPRTVHPCRAHVGDFSDENLNADLKDHDIRGALYVRTRPADKELQDWQYELRIIPFCDSAEPSAPIATGFGEVAGARGNWSGWQTRSRLLHVR